MAEIYSVGLPTDFSDAYLPRLFWVSDDLAMRAQRKYLRSVRFHILGIIGASFCQAAISLGPLLITWPAWFSKLFIGGIAAFVALTLATRALLRGRYWERIWYKSRSIAEEVKRLAWYYTFHKLDFGLI